MLYHSRYNFDVLVFVFNSPLHRWKYIKMVLCNSDHTLLADIIFVVEGTAINGAYIGDLKTNYIVPSLE